jgi:anti-sigma regulatory factor (Ser/Thr protein kinase)
MNVVAERFVVPADAKYLPEIRNFSSEYAQRMGLSRAEVNSIKLAIDEICSNIVLYAYRGMKRGDIQIEIQKRGEYVVVRIIDSGMAFDYSTVKVPDLEQYIEEGRRGGLGLQLVRKLTDRFHHERIDGMNIITLHKKIGSDPQ